MDIQNSPTEFLFTVPIIQFSHLLEPSLCAWLGAVVEIQVVWERTCMRVLPRMIDLERNQVLLERVDTGNHQNSQVCVGPP